MPKVKVDLVSHGNVVSSYRIDTYYEYANKPSSNIEVKIENQSN
jgi:hypothetical protein